MEHSEGRSQHQTPVEMKFFLRYGHDIVRTIKGDPGEFLNAANESHPNP